MTARHLAELARLADRAKACADWHTLWAKAPATVRAIAPERRGRTTPRQYGARSRVALASARKAWARVAAYVQECAL